VIIQLDIFDFPLSLHACSVEGVGGGREGGKERGRLATMARSRDIQMCLGGREEGRKGGREGGREALGLFYRTNIERVDTTPVLSCIEEGEGGEAGREAGREGGRDIKSGGGSNGQEVQF